ncbi:restriction endonuclease subunit S [Glycomyces paridis]|nr:restriction endonuclease subunit S [Glycomyces paridis]
MSELYESVLLQGENLPLGWNLSPLRELLQPKGLAIGVMYPGEHDPDGIPVVRVKDMRDGRILNSEVFRVAASVEQKHAGARFRGGEVLLSLVGSVGRVAVVPPELAGWNTVRAIAVLRLTPRVSSNWVKLCLSSEPVQQFIRTRLNTTVQATLNLRDVREIPIVIPPDRDRDAISNLMLALDDKIAVNERIATISLELADIKFDVAARDTKFGPETFGSVATVAGGGTPRTTVEEFWGGEFAWTTPTDVTALSAPYLFQTSRSITSSGLENCASQLYPARSIFMTSRATIGAFALPQIPAAVNQGFIVVLPPNEHMRWWLLHEMRSRLDEMTSLANGSTFLELSRKNFKAMPIRLPSAEIIAEFANFAEPLHDRAAQAVAESRAVAELRDTLLPQLMSGRLRVKDAEKLVEDAT